MEGTTMNLSEEIKSCLRMFGPCMVITIQQKLDLRGVEASHLEILNACEFMVNHKEIREATGFHGRAFKL